MLIRILRIAIAIMHEAQHQHITIRGVLCMNISRFSIKRPVFTVVTMLFVIILGVVSLLKIPITLIPELNPPIGVVVTSYPGASPQEVNEKIKNTTLTINAIFT